MKSRRFIRVSTVSLVAALGWSPCAYALGGTGHQRVVDEAWQVMRAVAGVNVPGQLRAHGLTAGTTADLTFDSPPSYCLLPATDPANLCKKQLTAGSAEWTAFVQATKDSLQGLNWLRPDLPKGSVSDPKCVSFQKQDRLDNFQGPVDPNAVQNVYGKDPNSCQMLHGRTTNVFQDFRTEDDGTGSQGLLLGWQSASRDHDFAELKVESMLIYGALMQAAGSIYETGVAVFLLPFVAIWSIFSGENVWDSSVRAADSTNPFDVLKGVLPGLWTDETSSKETGIFHFINPQPGQFNEYDDIQGMFYDFAGPNKESGALDRAIILGADVLSLSLDASDSDGLERYELIDSEVGSNKSVDRADWNWQSEILGSVAFTPLDNLAYYGDANFPRGGHPAYYGTVSGIFKYGWSLHAFGDATVPTHCAGTTSHGHRPYEEFVDQHIDDLFFAKDIPSANPTPAQQQDLKVNQLKQAQRVAAHAFRWWSSTEKLKDIRAVVTELAKETLAALPHDDDELKTGENTIWCDACSYGLYMNNPSTGAIEWFGTGMMSFFKDYENAAMKNPIGYFETYRETIRTNLERAAGVSAAYLVSRSEKERACSLRGQTCNATRSCCGSNASCVSGTCQQTTPFTLAADGAICQADKDCLGGNCTAIMCTSSATCPSGSVCSGGKCDKKVCGKPLWVGDTCTANSDCMTHNCSSGTCGKSAEGGKCRSSYDCESDFTCESGTCYRTVPYNI